MLRKLQGLLWAIGMVSGMAASAAAQEPLSPGSPVLPVGDSPVETLRERPQPATTVKEWVAQIEAATVQVTGVKLERSETGLDIVLETAAGKPLQVDATKFRREGNNLIAEIPNAVLALPQGQTFVADNPTADIARVQVVQRSGNIRVSVAGNNALPKTEVTLKTGGLAYSLNPEEDEPDEEIVVTGDRVREGYRVPNASTATRTDTPIRDIPASIQVVPRQVLEDRNVQREIESLETISGVVEGGDSIASFPGAGDVSIRGFSTSRGGNFRDGLRSEAYINFTPIGAIEQVEVLKGPASVLFGALEPGGMINYVTRKPLAEPYYAIGFEAGNYGLYQPSIDLSGPLTSDKNFYIA
jgi:iron complex outermembrane receptor protein